MIKDNVIIIDNAISEGQQDILEQLCTSVDFPWYYQQSAAYSPEMYKLMGDNLYFPVTDQSRETPFLCHVVYNSVEKAVTHFLHYFTPLITAVPTTVDQLISIRTNLTYPDPSAGPNTHGMPHVDCDHPRLITAIYYVNDSDGETIIFNQRRGSPDELTIKQRIMPKRGRLVVFDGTFLHAGNTPRNGGPRIVVNLNMIGYTNNTAN